MARARSEIQDNPYMKMPIERVREDAVVGVSLARRAYAERKPDKAAALGIGISPQQQVKGAPWANEKPERLLANSLKIGKSR